MMYGIIHFAWMLFFPLMFICFGVRLLKYLQAATPWQLPRALRYMMQGGIYGGMLYAYSTWFTLHPIGTPIIGGLAVGAMYSAYQLSLDDEEVSSVTMWACFNALLMMVSLLCSTGFHLFMPPEYIFLHE